VVDVVESSPSSISLLTLKRTESFARKLQLKLKNLNNSTTSSSSSSPSPEEMGKVDTSLESTSDAYFDFDIGSPPEDNQEAQQLAHQLLNELSPTGTAESCAVESGYVLSSRTLSPVESPTGESDFFATNTTNSEAGSSDASDSSVYYDVPEEFEEELPHNNTPTHSASSVVPTIVEPEADSSSEQNPQEEVDEDEEFVRHRIQRSTSLKSGKTPPGTPGRKKIVRFADALGLDLADVRTFLDEIPNVPTSAYK